MKRREEYKNKNEIKKSITENRDISVWQSEIES